MSETEQQDSRKDRVEALRVESLRLAIEFGALPSGQVDAAFIVKAAGTFYDYIIDKGK